MKHTEGTLKIGVAYHNDITIESAGDTRIAVMENPDSFYEPKTPEHTQFEQEQEANAHHLVACWNACEGINPEAVPDMYEALKDIKAWSEAIDGSDDSLEEIRFQCGKIATQAIAKAVD